MKNVLLFTLMLFFCVGSVSAQREIEKLNRGLIAFNKSNKVYINWRLFALEDYKVGFNVYRSVDGGDYLKINTAEVTATTDYYDLTSNVTQANRYYVVPVVGGVEQAKSEICTFAANTPSRQYFPIALEPIPGKAFTDYNILHIYPGDFDGDGDFDYLVKRVPINAAYNTILLDCYDNEGKFKWRIDLGPNVETYISSMTAPVLVADFNSDGKAEIILKTGELTVFGDGYKIGDTNGDGKTDYNSHKGSGTYANIMAGPEFLSYVDGETGAELDRNNFLTRRDPAKDWGDTYGARMNFMMSSVGYFDGVHPGVVFSRGDGGDMDIDCWQIVNGKLSKNWYYTARGKTFSPGWWADFHQIQCIDVDGDGKDEISWGACMMDDNGTVLYTTKYVHGDRFQITDIDPNRPGLEVFIIQQYNPDLIGSALYDAKTGTTIKDWYIPAKGDIGRGDVADVDPTHPGMEMFDTGNGNLHASDGTEIVAAHPYPWVSIYWDGDLLRENLIGVGSGGYNPAIAKWNYKTSQEDRLFSIYNDGGAYSVASPYGGRMALVGDIMGDWREEVFLETTDRTTLRIYSSYTPSEARLYTLMQNPSYRTAITAKMYLCTKYPDYFLGADMKTPPQPNVVTVSTDKVLELKAVAGDAKVDLSWIIRNFPLGTIQIMRDTDPNPIGRGRIAYGSGTGYTDNNVTNGTTYYYWLKITAADGSTENVGPISATPHVQNVTVRAKGVSGQEIIQISQNGIVYKTVTLTTAFANYTAGFDLVGNIRIDYINDATGRDAEVDYIIVDGKTFQAEDQAINTSFYANGTCGGGGFSQLMHCSGYIEFDMNVDCEGVIGGTAVIDNCTRCTGGTTNLYKCYDLPGGLYTFTSVHSGLQISSVSDFTQQTLVDGDIAQVWNVAKSGDFYTLFSLGELKYLSYDTATNLAGLGFDVGINTQFRFEDSGNGTLIIVPALDEQKAVDVYNTSKLAGAYLSFWDKSAAAWQRFSFTPVTEVRDCNGQWHGTAYIDNCSNCVGGATGAIECTTQTVTLQEGWNLVSLYVVLEDMTIDSVFTNAQVVKDADGFFQQNQPIYLNSITKLQAGKGYLIYNAKAETVELSGVQTTATTASLKSGWNLVGCPFATAATIDATYGTVLSATSVVKDFTGFWMLNGTTNSINDIEPGKAYFIKK